MEQYQNVFKRHEKKYLLTAAEYISLLGRINDRIVPDAYPETQICSLYFDTPDGSLIRRSLEGPEYKEKLRLRSYGIPSGNGDVFLELKKKYKGVVFKRRVLLPFDEAKDYLSGIKRPNADSQILREIDGFMESYEGIGPAMLIMCERRSWLLDEDRSIRITFDGNILWRDRELDPRKGIYGEPLLPPGAKLMEIKAGESIPVWLSRILSELRIFNTSFSKYGSAYTVRNCNEMNGGITCA